MTNEDLIKKWLSGELSDTEKKEFENSDEFTEINKLMQALKSFKAPEYNAENEYKNLFQEKPVISLYDRFKPVLKIAAIFIVLLTVSYFSYNYLNTIDENAKWIADINKVYLPDSSYVSLNKASKIRFSEKEWQEERNVELDGEAFFKVKKGSKFNVKTRHGIVSVLGTQFNVKDRGDYYEVSCYSGLVKVQAKQNTVLLKPGSVFRIINGQEEQYTVSNKLKPDWLNGESSFKSVPLSYVINEFERQYKVSVETKNINLNQLFTGGFTHNNMEIALKSITIPVNLTYKIKGDKIIIHFEDK